MNDNVPGMATTQRGARIMPATRPLQPRRVLHLSTRGGYKGTLQPCVIAAAESDDSPERRRRATATGEFSRARLMRMQLNRFERWPYKPMVPGSSPGIRTSRQAITPLTAAYSLNRHKHPCPVGLARNAIMAPGEREPGRGRRRKRKAPRWAGIKGG